MQGQGSRSGEEPAPYITKNLNLAKMSLDKLSEIKAVCRDLTTPELLQKCMKGRTQNPNESVHSKVWQKASKDKFCGLHRLKFVTRITVLEHNFGHTEGNLLHSLGFETSPYLLASLLRRDAKMIRKLETPKPRKSRKRKLRTEEEEDETADYISGGY